MGGGDKALLDLAGRPILAHVIERLAPQVARIVLNANGHAQRFAPFGLPVVADSNAGFAGPLAGILAGLRWAGQNAPTCSHLLTVTGDAPFIPADLGARLCAAVASDPLAIAVAASGGHVHPVIGLWPLAIADDLERDLDAGVRAVNAWCGQRQAIQVPFAAIRIGVRAVDPFFNANTPLDLAEARLIAQGVQYRSPVIGIAGWKNSGKTTLVCKLIQILSARGHRVSSIKFSHHEGYACAGQVGDSGAAQGKVRDTDRHAAAGGGQVVFAGPSRWAIVKGGVKGEVKCGVNEVGNSEASPLAWHEGGENRGLMLTAIVAAMEPADVIFVEGYKAAAIPKIEVRRRAQPDPRALAAIDPFIFAIASDHAIVSRGHWLIGLDETDAMADQIERIAGLCKVDAW